MTKPNKKAKVKGKPAPKKAATKKKPARKKKPAKVKRKPSKNRLKLTAKKKAKFLEVLRENGGHVRMASEAVAISYRTCYEHRLSDAEFAAAWEDAVLEGTERLEKEAWRRAHDGVRDPVYQGGELVGYVRKYSDTLLIFLLKGRKPSTYRDNARIEISGPDGGAIVAKGTCIDLTKLSALELAEYERLIKAQGGDE